MQLIENVVEESAVNPYVVTSTQMLSVGPQLAVGTCFFLDKPKLYYGYLIVISIAH